jgi:hypothetical protein
LVIESCHGVDGLMFFIFVDLFILSLFKELNPNWGYISICEGVEKVKNLKIDVTYYCCDYGLKLIKSENFHPKFECIWKVHPCFSYWLSNRN